jgi:DNA-binding winged helix-turn-helix (wHTH) protein/Tol biopolymer transport system component
LASNGDETVVVETFRSRRLVKFSDFEVDLQTGELRKAGMRLKLTGQPFQVLAILLEGAGEVITREELQRQLWPNTFVDVDHNLNSAINKIREALGDSSENPRFVETLPRRGYRFIAAVENPGMEVVVKRDADSGRAAVSSPAPVVISGVGLSKRWVRTIMLPAAIGLLVALGIGVLAVRHYTRNLSTGPAQGRKPAALEVRSLTENGKTMRAAATPDGRYVAYVYGDGGKFEIRLLQLSTERDVQVLAGSPRQVISLHFSPDGNFIYFLQQLDEKNPDAFGVFRIATLGGPAEPLAHDARMCSLTVSPDGKQIAYIALKAAGLEHRQAESQIVAIGPDGSNRHVLAERPLALAFGFLEWSPSQDVLAAVAIVGKDDMGLVKVDARSGIVQDLSVSGWGAVGQPAWSPDGTIIYAPAISREGSTTQIWAFDAGTGAHRTLTSGPTNYGEWSLSGSSSGDLIANTSTLNTNLWVTNHSGQMHRVNSLREEGTENSIWVGDRVVTSNMDEMVVHAPNGGSPTKLRSYSSIYRQLARCGPDHVAYWAVDAKDTSHIARTDVTNGSTTQLTDGPNDDEPTCTADGNTLVYVHCTDLFTRCVLMRKSLTTGESFQLYELGAEIRLRGFYPMISPDGAVVLFQKQLDTNDPYSWAITVPIAGGDLKKFKMPVPISKVGTSKWAADGKSILYALNENGVGNIWSLPLNGAVPRRLTAFDSDEIFDFDVATDNRLVVSRGGVVSDAVLIKNVR